MTGIRIAAVALWGLVLGAGCAKTPVLPEGVTALSISDPRDYWAKSGFVELVPGVHLPSSDHQIDQVEIWARVPQGALITEVAPESDVASAPLGLRFPPGSVLDRVEYGEIGGRRFVVDVRGTRIDDAGRQWFHVYRRDETGLFGYEWARDDAVAHAGATAALVARLAKAAPGDAETPAWVRAVEQKNACGDCHGLSRPTNHRQGEFGLVNRGTDASGFFTPWTVFVDEIPLERYGAHDRSETDPFTTIACPDASTPVDADDGRTRCASGVVPTGRYRLAEALRAAEPRALRVCAARAYLAGFLSPQLRQSLALALRECDDSPVTDPGPAG